MRSAATRFFCALACLRAARSVASWAVLLIGLSLIARSLVWLKPQRTRLNALWVRPGDRARRLLDPAPRREGFGPSYDALRLRVRVSASLGYRRVGTPAAIGQLRSHAVCRAALYGPGPDGSGVAWPGRPAQLGFMSISSAVVPRCVAGNAAPGCEVLSCTWASDPWACSDVLQLPRFPCPAARQAGALSTKCAWCI